MHLRDGDTYKISVAPLCHGMRPLKTEGKPQMIVNDTGGTPLLETALSMSIDESSLSNVASTVEAYDTIPYPEKRSRKCTLVVNLFILTETVKEGKCEL